MKVVFTGDFVRITPEGKLGAITNNIIWLHDLLGGVLASCGFESQTVFHEGSPGCDLAAIFAGERLPLTGEGWVKLLERDMLVDGDRILAGPFGEADVVVGFEIPPFLMRWLESRNIPFLDCAISPYRFGEDLQLMVRASDPEMRRRLLAGLHSREELSNEAALLKARTHRELNDRLNPRSLVFFGQSEVDRSLRVGESIATIRDHEEAFRRLAAGVEVIYFKAHPGAKPEVVAETREWFSTIAPVVLLDEPAYVSLCRPELEVFCTLSSGLLFEAPCFGKRMTHFLKPPYGVFCDVAGVPREEDYVNIGAAVHDAGFWKWVLRGKEEDRRDLPKRWSGTPHRLRDSLGGWWGFEAMTREFRIIRRQSLVSVEVAGLIDTTVRLSMENSRLLEERAGLQAEIGRLRSEAERLRKMLYSVPFHTHFYRAWRRLCGDSNYRR